MTAENKTSGKPEELSEPASENKDGQWKPVTLHPLDSLAAGYQPTIQLSSRHLKDAAGKAPVNEDTQPTPVVKAPQPVPRDAGDDTQPVMVQHHAAQVSPTVVSAPKRPVMTPPKPQAGRPEPTIAIPRQTYPPVGQPPSVPPSPAHPNGPEPEGRRVNWARRLLGLTLAGVTVFFLLLIGGIVGYIIIAAQLPSPDDLRARQPNFASSQIYDRNGRLLHEIIDQDEGKRTYVPVNHISPYLLYATVGTEDRNFYAHVGFDPIALVRALYYAIQEREIVSGASTITQQVARNVLLPDEASERTLKRKLREIILATELERRYSKNDILEIYVNNNNYGNLAYGIDAAARTYFGTSAANLTLAQASFLAGLPQSPATYDPYRGGRELSLRRHKDVLSLMVEAGYITADEAIAAAAEMDNYEFKPVYTDRIPAPHFITYVTQWVESELGPELLYTGSGLRIHTTLDPNLQRIAEEEVVNGLRRLEGRNVGNGALIALEPSSGHILAMVGSADFYDEALGGQVNVTMRCRQPGSAIKPLTYLAAFERGWNPATIIWDLPKIYTDTAGNTYEPVNYDGQFRGPTPVRQALANSLNIPAVKALDYVGVDALLDISARLGATSLVSPQLECPDYPYTTPPYYGLALTLGGGEMKLTELAGAYATIANGGMRMPPTPILWIEDQEGNVLIDFRNQPGEQVVKAEYAYQLTSILSDADARCDVFACNPNAVPRNSMELADRPVAAKTGSTNDTRDAWTVGYTPDIAAGVWVGNNDNSPMLDVLGSAGAAPIWQAFMQRAHEGIAPHNFPRPANIVEKEVCVLSGAEPSTYCPERTVEVFTSENLPLKADQDWWQLVEIDGNSGYLANDYCRSNIVNQMVVFTNRVPDIDGRNWLASWAREKGWMVAPDGYCTVGDTAPLVQITSPTEGVEIYQWIEIRGTVRMDELERYEIMFGVGDNPQAWGWISGPHLAGVDNGILGVWQIPEQQQGGTYTIRVLAYNKRGAQFESRVRVNILEPTPTPTLTPTMTPTPTLTPTPSPTPTITLTPTPTTTPEEAQPTPKPTKTLKP